MRHANHELREFAYLMKVVISAVVIVFGLGWPLIIASSGGHLAGWGWFVAVPWWLFLTAVTVLAVRGRRQQRRR